MPLYIRTLLVTGPREEVEVAAVGHREHIRALKQEGRIRVAGEFSNGDGFVEIFEAADLKEADRIARSGPLIEDGLGSWMVREIELVD